MTVTATLSPPTFSTNSACGCRVTATPILPGVSVAVAQEAVSANNSVTSGIETDGNLANKCCYLIVSTVFNNNIASKTKFLSIAQGNLTEEGVRERVKASNIKS